MTPTQREQLFAALMEGVPPVEEIGKVAHREMVEITTDDLDRIEPIIFQAGKRFADRKNAEDTAKPRETGDDSMNSHPFKEIDPQPMTDALGQDVLQNMLAAGARRGYEGRFDFTPEVHGPLTKLYELRQQACPHTYVRWLASRGTFICLNPDCEVVIDIPELLAPEPLLDYDLSGASSKVLPRATGDAPAREVSVRLHHIALFCIGVLLSTWWFVRSITLSISQ